MGDPIAWEKLELSNLQNVAQQVRYVAEKFRELCDELDPSDQAGSVLGHAATEEAAVALCAQHASISRRMDAMRRFYEINITAEESFFFERERLKLQRLMQRVKKSASLTYMVEEDASAPVRSRESDFAQKHPTGTEESGRAALGESAEDGFRNVHAAVPESARHVAAQLREEDSYRNPVEQPQEPPSQALSPAISSTAVAQGTTGGGVAGDIGSHRAQGFRFRLVLTPEEYDEYLSRKASKARGNWIDDNTRS